MKKNILIYNYNEPLPKQGGMERVTDTLACELAGRGCQVYLMCKVSNRLGEDYKAPVPIYFVPDKQPQEFILSLLKELSIEVIIDQSEGGIVGPFGFFKERVKALSYVALLAVQHNSTHAVLRNVVLIYGKHNKGFVGGIVNKIYNSIILPIKYQHFLYHARRVHHNLNKNYDRIITLSPAFIDEFMLYCPRGDRKKLIAIPNPNTFSISDVASLKKEKTVLYVGRLENLSKGVDRLLRIWGIVCKKHTDWKLQIVGDGSDRVALEQHAQVLGLINYSFEGFCSPQSYYEHASIFCMTSTFEGFGMVLTEAMQCGVVPMAFNSYASASDIIQHKKNGILIPPFDEALYACELEQLMTDTYMRKQFQNHAIKDVEKFSVNKVIDQWISLLNQI